MDDLDRQLISLLRDTGPAGLITAQLKQTPHLGFVFDNEDRRFLLAHGHGVL